LVQLKAIKPNWSVQSNVSYFIREAFTWNDKKSFCFFNWVHVLFLFFI
jgi:hypothetical protein